MIVEIREWRVKVKALVAKSRNLRMKAQGLIFENENREYCIAKRNIIDASLNILVCDVMFLSFHDLEMSCSQLTCD